MVVAALAHRHPRTPLRPLAAALAPGRRDVSCPLPADAREPLLERKRAVLRALRELAFEHEAGHIADDDYADLRARYEAEAGEILTELDRLGPVADPAARRAPRARRGGARGWRHPAAMAAGAVALLVFGIALGAGVVRYTTPETGPAHARRRAHARWLRPSTGASGLAPPRPEAAARR